MAIREALLLEQVASDWPLHVQNAGDAVRLTIAILAGVAVGCLALRRMYTRGRLVGFSSGWEAGERDGFRAGFSRGVMVDLSSDARERN